MDVFADAGAGPEGRTIIDDDPHAAETITTGPYPCWSMGWKDILAGAASRGETITNENCGRRIRLRWPGAGSLSGGKRQRRDLHRQGRVEGPASAARCHADLRARPRRDGQAQPGGEASRFYDRPSARGARREHRLHRSRHAAARRRLGGSVARARRCARHREIDERLQSDRGQEHGSRRYGPTGARGHTTRNQASFQRGQQPRVPEAGGGGRGLSEARSRRHRRRRRSRA